MKKVQLVVFGIVLGLGLCSIPANGQSTVRNAYVQDTTTAAYRSTLSGDSATDDLDTEIGSITTITTGDASGNNLKSTIKVSARFSSAGANCKVICVKGTDASGSWVVQGYSEQTVTAQSTYKVNSLYMANDCFFDVSGSTKCKLLVSAPSAGTVTLFKTLQ
jgi:hypothetical protein